MRRATNQGAAGFAPDLAQVTQADGPPARRWWHVGAACRRRTGALPVIKCIYLSRADERCRSPGARVQSDPGMIVIHRRHSVGTEEKDEGRGETKETCWPFPTHIHTHTNTHSLTHSSTKRPFINTSVHTADSWAMLVPPRGYSVYYTSQLKGCAQDQQSNGCGFRLGQDISMEK